MYIERTAGKRTFERLRHRWECNFEMVLQEVGWGDMDSISLAQNKDRRRASANAVINHPFP